MELFQNVMMALGGMSLAVFGIFCLCMGVNITMNALGAA